eukprot:scaffold1603_cov252-Chaetoceros_neogracile.AAC.2
MVYSSLRRLKSKEQSDVQAAIACAAVDNQINVMNINGGRPVEKKRNGGSLKRGSFKDIHQCVIQRLGINDPNFKVSVKSIQTRVYRNSLTVDEFQNQPVKSNSSRNQPAR